MGRHGRARTCSRLTRNQSRWHRAWEHAQRVLTPVPWPARVAVRLGTPVAVGVERHEITVQESLGGAERLRVGFASDFHAGPNTAVEVLANAAARLSEANVDLMLLGGDFVSLRGEYIHELLPLFSRLHAPLGCYAVLGNHDYWADPDIVRGALQDAGIRVLCNTCVRLPDPFGNVTLCGLDDHGSGSRDTGEAFGHSDGVRLVLMHQPSSLLDVADRPFAVALCGHTHGGQIATPGGRAILVAHGPLSRRYNAGRYDVGEGRTLLVSRGIGCGSLPIRYNSPASVTVCTLIGHVDGSV